VKKAAPLLLVAAAGLVTALLLYFRMRLEPPTVPTYELGSAPGGVVATDGGEIVVRRGGRFAMAAEPMGVVQGAVAARVFLVRGDDVQAWDPPFEVDRDGSVHIEGKVDQLFAGVPPGPWEVALVVGRPETLPTARDLLHAHDAGGGHAPWQVVRERIVLEG
jgi:hypothetical protein